MTQQHVSKNGDLADFAVFDELYPALRRFAAVVATSDVDPDDLLQDALLATLRKRDLSELDNPAAYLRRVIVNTASNKRRGLARGRSMLMKLRPESQTTDAYPSDLKILDQLPALDKAIIFLSDIEGEPLATIAEQLGLKPAAVRKRASRARAELRRLLGAELSIVEGTNS